MRWSTGRVPTRSSRASSSTCVAPRLSGPRRTRSIRSGAKACSSSESSTPSSIRRASRNCAEPPSRRKTRTSGHSTMIGRATARRRSRRREGDRRPVGRGYPDPDADGSRVHVGTCLAEEERGLQGPPPRWQVRCQARRRPFRGCRPAGVRERRLGLGWARTRARAPAGVRVRGPQPECRLPIPADPRERALAARGRGVEELAIASSSRSARRHPAPQVTRLAAPSVIDAPKYVLSGAPPNATGRVRRAGKCYVRLGPGRVDAVDRRG